MEYEQKTLVEMIVGSSGSVIALASIAQELSELLYLAPFSDRQR